MHFAKVPADLTFLGPYQHAHKNRVLHFHGKCFLSGKQYFLEVSFRSQPSMGNHGCCQTFVTLDCNTYGVLSLFRLVSLKKLWICKQKMKLEFRFVLTGKNINFFIDGGGCRDWLSVSLNIFFQKQCLTLWRGRSSHRNRKKEILKERIHFLFRTFNRIQNPKLERFATPNVTTIAWL